MVAALAASDAHLRGLTKSEPTLEDVFVELVGRGLDEADADDRACRSGPRERHARLRRRPSPRAATRTTQPAILPRRRGGAPRHVVATNLRSILGRAYPRIHGSTREKSWVFFEIALPFLSTCAFVLVYQALGAPEEYVGFAVIGGAMTAFWLNVLWAMGAQLYWDRGEGNLEIYFTAPVSLMSILVGMAVGGFYMTVTRAVVIIVVGSVLFGVQYAWTSGCCSVSCSS